MKKRKTYKPGENPTVLGLSVEWWITVNLILTVLLFLLLAMLGYLNGRL